MKFLICINEEGGMSDIPVEDDNELIDTLQEDRYHLPGEEFPIAQWARRAGLGDRYNYSKGVIIAISGNVKP
jgi:hypothetical protein